MEKKENSELNPVLCVLVLILALVSWLSIGPIAALVAMRAMTSLPESLQPLSLYIGIQVPYIFMFLALFLGSRFVLKRSLSSLLAGGHHPLRKRFILETGGIYLAFQIAVSLLFAGRTVRNAAPLQETLLFVIPVLLLTPMQAVSEEIFFRVLPAKIAYRDDAPATILQSLPLIFISGFIFMVPHLGNTEVQDASTMILPMLYYFIWGAFAMAFSLATDGFEAPAAMHAVNNTFIALAVNYEGSSMPTEALFIRADAGTAATLAETIAIFAILFIFAYRKGYILSGYMPGMKDRTR